MKVFVVFITFDCCTADSASRVSGVQTPPPPMSEQQLCINTFPLPMRWCNEGGRPPAVESEEEEEEEETRFLRGGECKVTQRA